MDSLAPFDAAVVVAVADDHGIDPETVRTLARRVQDHADSMPGVDELVMEWRRFRREDPLVARTDEAYLLAVPESVWGEFAEQLGLTDAEHAALRTLHDRQARHTPDVPTERFDERAALLLAR